ncbi:cytochrome P450 [Anderseniella sp. Alg231-50]|uniref:cytochrome P450 n=1 Tax=Anderseniella sp. Alg231-50 TaxID=1922226 RepID=UPI00307B2D58
MREQTKTTTSYPAFVDPATLNDAPHARLAELRRETPLVQFGPNQYLVLRAAHVQLLLTDPRTRQVEGPEFVALKQIPDGITARFISDLLLFSNYGMHRKKRGLFARSFAHRPMQEMRGQVRAVADRIIASLPRGESFDFVDCVAARVPAEMIASILGLPEDDTRHFARLVYDASLAFGPVYPHDRHDTTENATKDLFHYVKGQLRLRMAASSADLLSALVTDWQEDHDIPFDSLAFQVVGLIIAGSDTTRSAFAMLIALLLERPSDWPALLSDHGMIPGAVKEGLRCEPSVATIPRLTTAPVELDDIEVPAGVALSLSTMSAMRDPAVYANPERFDIRRTDHPRFHPVFGLGPHRCIGEMLARIEMEESLAAILDGAPRIELLSPPRMLGFGGIRQITPMQVRIF